jgi:choline-glycine betaine transporter
MTFRQPPRWAAVIGILFLVAMTALALVTEESLTDILTVEIFGALPLAIIWLTAQRPPKTSR